MIRTALDAIITIDADGRIVEFNPAAERTFHRRRDAVLGRPLAETIIPTPFRDQHVRGLARYLRTGEARVLGQRIEVPAIRAGGDEFPAELAIAPIHHPGQSALFTAFIRDISDRKSAEAELQTAKDAAEAANQSKSAFLANMSHEIRTPLTAILGFADILMELASSPELSEPATIIKRNGEHLLTIINDILDLSKIESGKLELERVTFPPRAIIDEVAELMQVNVRAKGLAFQVRYVGPIPELILGDPTRTRQILMNLTGNAIKFTETGGIEVRVSFHQFPDVGSLLQIEVIDTGIGMSADQLDGLFQPFVQADSSHTRRFGGTGLGLAISRRLARRSAAMLLHQANWAQAARSA